MSAAAGDYMLSADGAPLGRIESVVDARSGLRLLIALAFTRGSLAVAPLDALASTVDSPTTRLRWHTLSESRDEILRRGIFRRQLGRLTSAPLPAPFGTSGDDTVAAEALRQALNAEAMTAGDLTVHVERGVAVLAGWLATIGGKVGAERLARTTPGVWDAVNRLVSDEELSSLVRSCLLTDEAVARQVERVVVSLGRVRIHPLHGHQLSAETIRRVCHDVAGYRELVA